VPRSQEIALGWLGEGRRVVAATLIQTLGSAPLAAGAEMLIADSGEIEGSVTGGCVEAALVQDAHDVLAGAPPRLVRYGINDDDAVGVGLTCGGTVELFVHELTVNHHEVLRAVADARTQGEAVALVTLLEGERAGAKLAVLADRVVGSLGADVALEGSVTRQEFGASPQMLIFGATEFSAALARLASELGYRVTICDPRSAFLQSPRFSSYARTVIDWPDRYLDQRTLGPRDAVLVFTHDPKLDEPALTAALGTDAGYIGALGSRRTHAERFARLRRAGVDGRALARISSPCGLDIGGATPPETAVAILAEIVALRAGRGGGRLKDGSGPLHLRSAAATAVVLQSEDLPQVSPASWIVSPS